MFSYLLTFLVVFVGEIENSIISVFRPRSVYNPGPHHFTPMNLPNGAFNPNYRRPAIVAAEKTGEYNPGLPAKDMQAGLSKMKSGLDIINNSPFLKTTQNEEVITNVAVE